MKRNTALRWIAWLGTFGLAEFATSFHFLRFVVSGGVDGYFPVTLLVVLVGLSMFFGSILIGLFGYPKADKPIAK